MSILAIIPARGGSKRIPRKNIKNFVGQPIIKYSIDAALQSGIFDEIMVSTDDEEIANVSDSFGAKIPFMRSAKNSGDMAFTVPVLEEVVREYEKLNRKFDSVCCIYPTAPFITPERLKKAYELFTEKKPEAVVAVMKFSYPIQRAMKIEEGRTKMFWPENYNVRTQDLEPAYHDCGQFYFLKTDAMLEQKVLYPEFTIPIIIPSSEGQDIDNEEDWDIAEIKFKLQKKYNALI
jgi:N-acylneuraminate cytidylyltransferase